MEDINTENKNRAAFACVDSENRYLQMGLTKRECFAGLAMQGIMTDKIITPENAAKIAVKSADALLKELRK